MDHNEFMHYLRHGLPNWDCMEVVPRTYKNVAGIDQIISLCRINWDYADWLEANTDDIKISDWVIHCETHPFEGYTLPHLLMYWLWLDECNRFREGLPTPRPYPPMGYKGWGDEHKSA